MAIFSPVYPRVLGEREMAKTPKYTESGLSPCARGTRSVRGVVGKAERFIPVCSGNAYAEDAVSGWLPVYPRVLGEREMDGVISKPAGGLSPCARGTPRRPSIGNTTLRFIPVCSGNAVGAVTNRRWLTVYPRVLGERHHQEGSLIYHLGLSPCARGTRRNG